MLLSVSCHQLNFAFSIFHIDRNYVPHPPPTLSLLYYNLQWLMLAITFLGGSGHTCSEEFSAVFGGEITSPPLANHMFI